MRNIILAVLFLLTVVEAEAKSIIELVDISGSVCDEVMSNNLRRLNSDIDGLDKHDRFIVIVYKSRKPFILADKTMPDRSGRRNKLIEGTRANIRVVLAEKFKEIMTDEKSSSEMGEATDILGAVAFASLLINDLNLNANAPVILNHYSDGINTVGMTGSHTTVNNQQYTELLKKKLGSAKRIDGLEKVELNWYGASSCYDKMDLSEVVSFQKNIKDLWVQYLSLFVSKVNYFLTY